MRGMFLKTSVWFAFGMGVLLFAPGLRADETVKLKLVAHGAVEKIGSHRAQLLQLSATKPANVRKIPAGIEAPLYSVLELGDPIKPSKFTVLADDSRTNPRLFVDSNGDGDLTNDPPAVWEPRPYDSEHKMQFGGATIQIKTPDGILNVGLTMFRYDPTDPDPRRKRLSDKIIYYGDYAREGDIRLGGKTYHALLIDAAASGDFRGHKPISDLDDSGVLLWLDVNGNGTFDRTGEKYDAAKPFNIAGVTYEIKKMRQSGASFEIVKSDKSVEEIPAPLNLSKGHPAVAFNARTMDGKTIHFPADFRGKIVLLDFWAMFDAPGRNSMPALVKIYNTYHAQNFEIIGVSLDPKDATDTITAFAKSSGMTWPEIYDGGYWSAEAALKYGIESLPRAFLIDGDTGEILAESAALHGEGLEAALKAAMKKKGK